MKNIDCKRCGKSTFICRSGEHVQEPGKIHSGWGAAHDSVWDCPNCRGKGFISVSIIDRICQAIFERGSRVNAKVHPRSF